MKKGVYTGKATYTVNFDDGSTYEYEGAMANGTQNGPEKSVEIDAAGSRTEYTCEFYNGNFTGEGTEKTYAPDEYAGDEETI